MNASPNARGKAAPASSPVARIGRLPSEILTAAPPRPPPKERPALEGTGLSLKLETERSKESARGQGSQLAASPAAEISFDPSESFETARPVHVARSDRLIELHAAADRYFARWLEHGDPVDIQRAAELAEEARQLAANS